MARRRRTEVLSPDNLETDVPMNELAEASRSLELTPAENDFALAQHQANVADDVSEVPPTPAELPVSSPPVEIPVPVSTEPEIAQIGVNVPMIFLPESVCETQRLPRNVEFVMTPRQRVILERIFRALRQDHRQLASGRHIEVRGHVVQWLLDNIHLAENPVA